ncbi:hypothetical protein N0V82_008583 [Gnomoniopsis sp. IMI 355080]|nr:hypothetical protein N0V82_008583 [Gnomoniopsis sp. IMI 355080]
MTPTNEGATAPNNLTYMDSLLYDGSLDSYPRFSNPPFFAQRRCHLKDSTPHFHVEQQGYDSTNPGDSRNIITSNGQGKRVELQFTTGLLQAESRPPGAYINGEIIIMAINSTRNQGQNITRRVREIRNNIKYRRPVGIIIQKNATKPSSPTEPPVFPCNDMETDLEAWHLAHIPTCLNDECPKCWRDIDGSFIVRRHRTDTPYHTKFLQERYDRLNPTLSPVPLEPYYPNILPTFDSIRHKTHEECAEDKYTSVPTLESVQRLNQRCGGLITGFGCPQCGMTNSRVKWEAFHCRNASCGFYSLTAPPTLTPEYMLQVNEVIAQQKNESRFDYEGLIGFRNKRALGDFGAFEYKLADGCYLAILKPRKDSKALVTSKKIFSQLLAAANDGSLGLERRGMQRNGGRGYTRHFSANFGELYAWGAAVPTTKYEDSTDVVSLGQEVMNRICKPYLDGEIGEGLDKVEGPGQNDFNQLYIPAYLGTNMSMSLHDDGEKGLGHFIATYTIGGYGRFTIALKPTPNYGREMTARGKPKPKGKWLEEDPLVPGCTRYEERRALWRRYEKGIISKKQWQAEFKDLMKSESGSDQKLMQFPVRHGDIVLMYGHKAQKMLNHALTNESPIRFALTGRRVVGEMATAKHIKAIDDWIQADKEYVPSGAQTETSKKGKGTLKRSVSEMAAQGVMKRRKVA